MNTMPVQARIEKQLLPCLSPAVRSLVAGLGPECLEKLQEIRLRLGLPLAVRMGGESCFVARRGGLAAQGEETYRVEEEDIKRTLAAVSGSSVYALEEELRRGYITLPGGHRVGLAGRTVLEGGRVKTLTDFSSLSLRVAREVTGCAGPVAHRLLAGRTRFPNTLVLSPPGCGKTTILRDLARILSSGSVDGRGMDVAVIDERSELAGSYEGRPQLDIGPRTDVIDGCPKAEGIIMAIRALAPQVVVTDELGHEEDVGAVRECLNAGISLLASAHAGSREEAASRPILAAMFSQRSFDALVLLSNRRGPGTLENIIDLERKGGGAGDDRGNRIFIHNRGGGLGGDAQGRRTHQPVADAAPVEDGS